MAAEIGTELGYFDDAEQRALRSLEVIESLGNERFSAYLLHHVARAKYWNGKSTEVDALLDEALARARRTRLSFIGPRILGFMAWTRSTPAERKAARNEGEQLIEAGCVAHNALWFYRDAIEGALLDEIGARLVASRRHSRTTPRAIPFPGQNFSLPVGELWPHGDKAPVTRRPAPGSKDYWSSAGRSDSQFPRRRSSRRSPPRADERFRNLVSVVGLVSICHRDGRRKRYMGYDLTDADAARDYWATRAPQWDAWADDLAPLAERFNAALIAAIDVRPGQTLLDLASGAGEPALTLAKHVGPSGSVTATDLVPEMLAGARRRIEAAGLTNVSFEICGIDDLPFEDSIYDAATCRFGLMFVPDVHNALSSVRRVLKPGGQAVCMVWGHVTPTRCSRSCNMSYRPCLARSPMMVNRRCSGLRPLGR